MRLLLPSAFLEPIAAMSLMLRIDRIRRVCHVPDFAGLCSIEQIKGSHTQRFTSTCSRSTSLSLF